MPNPNCYCNLCDELRQRNQTPTHIPPLHEPIKEYKPRLAKMESTIGKIDSVNNDIITIKHDKKLKFIKIHPRHILLYNLVRLYKLDFEFVGDRVNPFNVRSELLDY